MPYYEVLVADSSYKSDAPLTYVFPGNLQPMTAVSVPLRNKLATAFVLKKVKKPEFKAKEIKTILSVYPLPSHLVELAKWLSDYYVCSLSDALKLCGPATPSARQIEAYALEHSEQQTSLAAPLTAQQKTALKKIADFKETTVLLHGATGSGKTRVYLEEAKKTLQQDRSVIILTPEISLTAQLADTARHFLGHDPVVLHSQLGNSERKKLWLKILESNTAQIIIGARSALFSPVKNLGLIVVDEAHEPAYKQEQSPRYNAVRAASQLGHLAGAKVILGSATPGISDYFVASSKKAIINMPKSAIEAEPAKISVIDLKDRNKFSQHNLLANELIDAIKSTLSANKQIMIYLNRRGSARLVLCKVCGWQALCPNCDIPTVYHSDVHKMRCHNCSFSSPTPAKCPTCGNLEIIFSSVGTKYLLDEVKRLFPQARVQRFDSDNTQGERLHEVYAEITSGKIDILVGTQVLAKGLDLPHLAVVGIISADSSLGLPDFSAEERSFQLLYQIVGRVGRGHTAGQVIIQTYQPDSLLIKAAAERDYVSFYKRSLAERESFKFPPSVYLAQMICKKTSAERAESSAKVVKNRLADLRLPINIIGPVAPFYAKRGGNYYSQLILKSKSRKHLQTAARHIPAGWQVNLDPADLL